MQTDNRLLDDLARLASGALGAAAAAREEFEAAMKAAFRRWLSELDLVTRDEFEAVRALAENAMEKAAALEERLAALEAAAGRTGRSTGKKRGKSAAARGKRSSGDTAGS
ncbi:MAG: accessory factor UbiK family protein [Alphaproteobacteria bacterium]|nr:MAG: accessory factor UbiK family protein [Alphaproteobacteria bacterium]